MIVRKAWGVAALSLWWITGCVDEGYEDPQDLQAPVIEEVRPDKALAGTTVNLLGRNFGLPGERDRLWLGGVELTVRVWQPDLMIVDLPFELRAGQQDFVIRSGGRVSAPWAYRIIPRPSEAPDADPDAPIPDSGIGGGLGGQRVDGGLGSLLSDGGLGGASP